MSQLWLYAVWVTNGFLLAVYYTAEHGMSILLAGSSASFVAFVPREQRSWAAASSALAITASLAAPFPVPMFMLMVSVAGWLGRWLERFNRPAQQWNTIRGQALYAMAGLGYAAYHGFGWNTALMSDPTMAQGGTYFDAILAIAMYAIPLGIIVMLVQNIWAHPPSLSAPSEMIANIRTRGKG